MTFGLNALYGRRQIKKRVWGGDWDSTNAYELMKYTVAKGYPVDSWEFGISLHHRTKIYKRKKTFLWWCYFLLADFPIKAMSLVGQELGQVSGPSSMQKI